MIHSIKGKIIKISNDHLIIEAGGIGYKVFSNEKNLEALKKDKKKNYAKIFCHYVADKGELFGFLSEEDLDMFEILLNISGIGPKIAMKILNVFSPKELAEVVFDGDVESICDKTGLGKKNASKLIIELQGKIKFLSKGSGIDLSEVDRLKELQQILKGLGYKSADIKYVVKNIGSIKNEKIENLVKKSLKMMADRNRSARI